MSPDQAIACLAALLNAPVIKLAVGIQDLAACDAALRTLAEAVQPKPENVVPIDAARPPTTP